MNINDVICIDDNESVIIVNENKFGFNEYISKYLLSKIKSEPETIHELIKNDEFVNSISTINDVFNEIDKIIFFKLRLINKEYSQAIDNKDFNTATQIENEISDSSILLVNKIIKKIHNVTLIDNLLIEISSAQPSDVLDIIDKTNY